MESILERIRNLDSKEPDEFVKKQQEENEKRQKLIRAKGWRRAVDDEGRFVGWWHPIVTGCNHQVYSVPIFHLENSAAGWIEYFLIFIEPIFFVVSLIIYLLDEGYESVNYLEAKSWKKLYLEDGRRLGWYLPWWDEINDDGVEHTYFTFFFQAVLANRQRNGPLKNSCE